MEEIRDLAGGREWTGKKIVKLTVYTLDTCVLHLLKHRMTTYLLSLWNSECLIFIHLHKYVIGDFALKCVWLLSLHYLTCC